MPLELIPDPAVEAFLTVPGFWLGFHTGACVRHNQNWLLQRSARFCTSISNRPTKRVLNAAARLLLRVPRFDRDLRIKVKDKLHWQRAPERVAYKLCTLVYKLLHGLASGYLAELCITFSRDSYHWNLRSADKNKLLIPRHKLSTYGPRSFSIPGPSAWNSLSQHLRDDHLSHEQFLSRIKTHLFCSPSGSWDEGVLSCVKCVICFARVFWVTNVPDILFVIPPLACTSFWFVQSC